MNATTTNTPDTVCTGCRLCKPEPAAPVFASDEFTRGQRMTNGGKVHAFGYCATSVERMTATDAPITCKTCAKRESALSA